MKFSEMEFKRLMKSYQKKNLELLPEEETELNILVFINTIHLNKQDFYASYFDSHCTGMWNFGLEKRVIVYLAIA